MRLKGFGRGRAVRTLAGRRNAATGGWKIPTATGAHNGAALSPFRRIAASALCGMLLFLFLRSSGLTKGIGHTLYDAAARIAAEPAPAGESPVELVFIDQYSLGWAQDELGLSWPWPREIYGAIAGYLAPAKAQAFDLLFTERSSYGPEDDAAFGKAMAQAGNVVLASPPAIGPEARPSVFSVPGIEYGDAGCETDEDGVLRKYDPWPAGPDGRFPSLGAAVLLKSGTGIPLPEKNGGKTPFLRFSGARPSFPAHNAAEILASIMQGDAGHSPQLPPGHFEGKIVFIGCSAPGLLDAHAVPTTPAMPGPEIHATFADNVIRGRLLEEADLWAELIFMSCVAILGAVSSTLLKKPLFLGMAGVLLAASPFLAGLAAYRNGFVLDMAPLIAASLGTGACGIILAYSSEGRQRAFIRKSFSHYVAPAVIDGILRDPGSLGVGGRKRTITVFFSDIEGFTEISESLVPETLMEFLRLYFSIMTRTILEEGGTVDKFVGDSIMAFWNAPLQAGDHALRAVKAALRCQEAIGLAAGSFAEIGAPVPRTRIGIDTGEAVVGNMGSPARFDYTAIGDVVNTASRLEGANRRLGTRVLMSSRTCRSCLDALQVSGGAPVSPGADFADLGDMKARRLGYLLLQGKTVPTEVWEPVLRDADFSDKASWEGLVSLSGK